MPRKVRARRPRAAKAPKPTRRPFEVIRDTREQAGHGWDFPPDAKGGCTGTVVEGLPTGDYTVRGLETVLCIERKASTGEFSQNVSQARFTRELERMREFQYAFVVLDFSMDDILNFPANSGIPNSKWKYLRVTPEYLHRRLCELMVQFPNISFVLAGKGGGSAVAYSLMKRVIDSIDSIDSIDATAKADQPEEQPCPSDTAAQ